ncbi:fibroblast growth factor-binding protein 3 [Trichechus manatus latirostris]|uniref:Fibroblast growth factor-binding protein 3 n=1 Tax=Trichechus manatus latirostris TaxID=127582 RepID=A0A2Y9D9G9_TRIMA|nr:fibroblast growth factor-binding protein 3 [Trichechus manatus latirostris]
MTPPRVQASLSLLVLGGCLLAAAQRDKGAARSAAQPAVISAGRSSGRFISPEQHACSWQLLLPTPGAAAGSELALSCQGPDGARYQCVYHAEPERCAAYAGRGAHYWKQVLGRLRKNRLPCHDPVRLRSRLCYGKKGHDAELRLAPRASPPAGPTSAGFPGEPKPRARGRGRAREHAPGPAAGAPPPTSTPSKQRPSEKKTKGGRRKGISILDEERPLGTGLDLDGPDENAELTETYCAEKWHSLCNFFVNFWNG